MPRRRARALGILLALVTALGAAPAAHAASVKSEAQGLAKDYATAKTKSKREAAILAIFRATGLGVFKAKSFENVVKTRYGKNGPYLYDFEIDGLSQASKRKARLSWDSIATTISSKFPDGYEHLLGSELQASSAASVKAALAGKIKGNAALMPLVANSLAARDGVNLQTVSPSAESLDPLLGVLATADVTGAIVNMARKAGAARAAVTALAARKGCDSMSGATQGSGQAAQWIAATALTKLGEGALEKSIRAKISSVGGAGLAIATEVAAAIHGMAMGISIGFTDQSVTAEVSTGFGHSSFPRAGQPVIVKAKAEMLDDYGQSVIRCGALLGFNIPGKGGISGLRVDWAPVAPIGESTRDPQELGVKDCPVQGCDYTDGDGVSTWKLQPDDELLPGTGEFTTQLILMEARLSFQGATNNTFGSIAEFIGLQKTVIRGITIRWHQPDGYHFDLQSLTYTHTDTDSRTTTAETPSYRGEDQCLPGSSKPHPTYPPQGLAIGLIPGAGENGSHQHWDVVTTSPGSEPLTTDADGWPFQIATPVIPPGPLSATPVKQVSDWNGLSYDDQHPTMEAGWYANGGTPQVQFTFNAPGYSPSGITYSRTPTASELCTAAKPLFG